LIFFSHVNRRILVISVSEFSTLSCRPAFYLNNLQTLLFMKLKFY
jgi:hypothetical protein